MANEKVCPQCGTRYEADHMFCFLDGAALIQAQNSTDLVGSIIADRYRVVSKIGDGGMPPPSNFTKRFEFKPLPSRKLIA